MYDKIVCVSVSCIRLTEEELLALLLAARRLILSGKQFVAAVEKENLFLARVTVSECYRELLGLRSREFKAVINRRDGTTGLVSYIVDEEYLREVSVSDLMAEYERECARTKDFKIVTPQNPHYN